MYLIEICGACCRPTELRGQKDSHLGSQAGVIYGVSAFALGRTILANLWPMPKDDVPLTVGLRKRLIWILRIIITGEYIIQFKTYLDSASVDRVSSLAPKNFVVATVATCKAAVYFEDLFVPFVCSFLHSQPLQQVAPH